MPKKSHRRSRPVILSTARKTTATFPLHQSQSSISIISGNYKRKYKQVLLNNKILALTLQNQKQELKEYRDTLNILNDQVLKLISNKSMVKKKLNYLYSLMSKVMEEMGGAIYAMEDGEGSHREELYEASNEEAEQEERIEYISRRSPKTNLPNMSVIFEQSVDNEEEANILEKSISQLCTRIQKSTEAIDIALDQSGMINITDTELPSNDNPNSDEEDHGQNKENMINITDRKYKRCNSQKNNEQPNTLDSTCLDEMDMQLTQPISKILELYRNNDLQDMDIAEPAVPTTSTRRSIRKLDRLSVTKKANETPPVQTTPEHTPSKAVEEKSGASPQKKALDLSPMTRSTRTSLGLIKRQNYATLSSPTPFPEKNQEPDKIQPKSKAQKSTRVKKPPKVLVTVQTTPEHTPSKAVEEKSGASPQKKALDLSPMARPTRTSLELIKRQDYATQSPTSSSEKTQEPDKIEPKKKAQKATRVNKLSKVQQKKPQVDSTPQPRKRKVSCVEEEPSSPPPSTTNTNDEEPSPQKLPPTKNVISHSSNQPKKPKKKGRATLNKDKEEASTQPSTVIKEDGQELSNLREETPDSPKPNKSDTKLKKKDSRILRESIKGQDLPKMSYAITPRNSMEEAPLQRNKRSRPMVNYTEPSMRQKMRRPN